ncbi:MAG: GTP-binding protein [Lachnospiraceae bacterium]|nr:GTP-binding protein [Lachnospiraceae bacterium]
MIKIDLITGFLGAGKTTFIKKYARYLIEKGQNIGILENDYGAVNVDMMLLQDLMGDRCELEMVAGGCHRDCHRRRFKSKLIAMGMCGYDRVLVEPSGIYDVDEFFDVLQEEPLNQWYEIGNVITIVDANLEPDLSAEADYLLASEVANAGCVVMSKSRNASEEEMRETVAHLNRALESVRCGRRFAVETSPGRNPETNGDPHENNSFCPDSVKDILIKDWDTFQPGDFEKLITCGYVSESYQKMSEDEETFQSVYFMNIRISEEQLREAVADIFADPACGDVFRMKGFLRAANESEMPKSSATPGLSASSASSEHDTPEKQWLQLNATRSEITLEPISVGQEVLIVIGEQLDEAAIQKHLAGNITGVV